MLKFGNKEFRNLQEQVLKNMQDINSMKEGTAVLDEFGIKVVGEVDSLADLPTVAEYKEAHEDWAYGDAYAVGTEAPYTLYILTRENETTTEDHWFDIGEFPAPGPQGETGPEGPVGPQGQTGNPGADGVSAGFGTITATAQTLVPGSSATATVVASGPDTAKSFAFTFGIPRGQKGEPGGINDVKVNGTSVVSAGVANIDLTDYIEYSTTLRDGTSFEVKDSNDQGLFIDADAANERTDVRIQSDTFNVEVGTSSNAGAIDIFAADNIDLHSNNGILTFNSEQVAVLSDISKLQATATIVIDALTNLNGRIISNFEATLDTSTSYPYYVITRGGSQLTEEQARDYMEYMTGSRFLPVFDYETPENSLFIFANGSLWKPQFDNQGLKLYALPNPYASKVDLTNYVTLASDQTISGKKTFSSGKLVTPDIYAPNVGGVGTYKAFNLYGGIVAGNTVRPSSNARKETGTVYGFDLGEQNYRWRDLYLYRNLSDGTNSIAVANIANKSNFVTLTQAEYDALATKDTNTYYFIEEE